MHVSAILPKSIDTFAEKKLTSSCIVIYIGSFRQFAESKLPKYTDTQKSMPKIRKNQKKKKKKVKNPRKREKKI